RKVRVLCWIMTQPKQSSEKKCQAIRSTWGKRCDVLLFFSSKHDYNFPIIGLNVSEGRNHLTGKTIAAFDYIYKHHFNDADWFMKADDDAYVIVENLKYFLSGKNPEDLVYYGQVFTRYVKPHGYNSGGAGYVVSTEALKRFGQRNSSLCPTDGAGISRHAISFHYMRAHDMYIMDFALHHLKAHGYTFPPYRENDNGEEKSPYS
ncbi:hypothetical protein LOTGIDRAFT_143168, partial [Lottia gigantea]